MQSAGPKGLRWIYKSKLQAGKFLVGYEMGKKKKFLIVIEQSLH